MDENRINNDNGTCNALNTPQATPRRTIQRPKFTPIHQPTSSFPWETPIFKEILKKSGFIEIFDQTYSEKTIKDLHRMADLGFGTNGNVSKCRIGDHIIAVKDLKLDDSKEMKQALMELNVIRQSSGCPYIIRYFGYICTGTSLYICMEYMACCLEKLQEKVPQKCFPEKVVGHVSISVIRALDYLREKEIIHRDVKPSNMLVDKDGNVKLCDFAISGQLVDSMAQSCTPGCILYLAPERIALTRAEYDVRSDVWSLGISLFKMSTGKNPYLENGDGSEASAFMVLKRVKENPAPILMPTSRLSEDFCNFVNSCLRKNPEERPKYKGLMEKPFFENSQHFEKDARSWLHEYVLTLPLA